MVGGKSGVVMRTGTIAGAGLGCCESVLRGDYFERILLSGVRPILLTYGSITWPKRPHYGFNTRISDSDPEMVGPAGLEPATDRL